MDSAYKLIHNFNRVILNPIIFLMFGIALIVFIYGVFEYAKDSSNPDSRETGKNHILWGVVGMFIMFSVFAIIKLVMGTFGISNSGITKIIP